LTLIVEDTGLGVPPDMRDRVFEPFVTGGADGTGLGLAIARELADAHHGRLVLRAQTRDKGAVFAVELPEGAAWPQA
jgi:signal transduction histidine kinase